MKIDHLGRDRLSGLSEEIIIGMKQQMWHYANSWRILAVTLFSVASLAALRQAQAEAQLQPGHKRHTLDQYGGTLAANSTPTGYFRIEKIKGRWWFITPEGNGFLSAGVNHIDYREDYSDEFVDFAKEHLRDWGFNTIGWTQELIGRDPKTAAMVHSPGWGPPQYARLKMPYMHLIRFTGMEWYVDEAFPDVFSQQFANKCDRLAREICTKLRDDPYLIGYFYSDTPNWPLWAQRIGKEKLPAVAQQYYQVIHDAIRRYDQNHLLLGDRYKGDRVIPIDRQKVNGLPDAVLEAMKSTVDVLCVEYYRPDPRIEEDLDAWHALTEKPILMADSAFLAPTDALHPNPKGPVYAASQAARGEDYQTHARRLYTNPLVIGWHWCAFGRSAGRKSGLLDGKDQPYEACIRRMEEFNRNEMYQVAMRRPKQGSTVIEPDAIGGTPQIRSEATGYFRVEKINQRWWFVTPKGNGFLSVGVNHMDLAALKHSDNIHIFQERYGGEDDRYIREGIAQPLRDWGFNTVSWTQELVGGRWMKKGSILRHSKEWTQHQFHEAGLPYIYNLKFADIEGFNTHIHYPDVYENDFDEWADYVARRVCVNMASDPLLLGYADVPVPAMTADKPGAWAEGLDLEDPNDLEKLQEIVRRYFEATTQAIRTYDPNHMIFGPRFGRPKEVPDWLLKLAGEYFDVLLMNRYVTARQVQTELKRWNDLTGRPVMISDMLYLAPTELLSVDEKAPAYVPNQKARGQAYANFAEAAFSQSFVVGLHWCAFLENRTRKSGLKNYLDEPYQDCVGPMKEFNRNHLYPTALGQHVNAREGN